MPLVTDIKWQQRREGRFSVYVDGEYAFALGDLELSGSDLHVGSQLSLEQVADWQQRAGESKAYDQALRYLAIRRRSRVELERQLRRKDWDDEIIQQTIDRLEGLGLVNDAEFAGAWIRERQLLRPRSVQMLRAELMKLGVGREDIDTALADNGPDEVATIRELAERRRRQYRDPEKLMAYLARQGFSYSKIKEALKDLEN